MKKIIKITVVLFLLTTILNILLNYIVTEQILSRILFGVDYNTYFTNYYSGTTGLLKLISENKMPYEWIFQLSKIIIAAICIFIAWITIKKLKNKYTVTKKEFIIIMIIFSMLSLYNIVFYILMFYRIPPAKFLVLPILYIVSVGTAIYKIMGENR